MQLKINKVENSDKNKTTNTYKVVKVVQTHMKTSNCSLWETPCFISGNTRVLFHTNKHKQNMVNENHNPNK